MPEDHELTFSIALQAGLDAVWDLLTTGIGRAAWFGTEGTIDLRVGGLSVVSWGGEDVIEGQVVAVDEHQRVRIAYLYDGQEMGAEEWLLSHDDGVTVVRLIQSLPDPVEYSWDGWFGDLERGWHLFLASLRHAAESAVTPHRTSTAAYRPVTSDREQTWTDLCRALDLTDPETGTVVEVAALGSATVTLCDPPHSLLLTTPTRTLLCDLEGPPSRLVLFAQAATHGQTATGEESWRKAMIDQLPGRPPA